LVAALRRNRTPRGWGRSSAAADSRNFDLVLDEDLDHNLDVDGDLDVDSTVGLAP
jgi:hypothetical protein